MELADLFPLFPDIDDPEFQSIVSSKQEYRELETTAREEIPKFRGELFRQQKVIQRIMREVDEMGILHEPGSGKTCAAVSVMEYFHQILGQSPYTRAIILTASDKLRNEIKYQIICKCTNGMYETDKIKEKTGKALQAEITKTLKKWYTIDQSPEQYTKDIWMRYWRLNTLTNKEEPDTDAIRRDFSGLIFWLDEAHDLIIKDSIDSIELPSTKDPSVKNEWKKQYTYKILWILFHTINQRKIIISTATPMPNFPQDAGSLFNLIIPADRQFNQMYDFDNATLEDLRYHIGGRISYVRSLDTGIDIKYQGEPLEGEYEIAPDEFVEYQDKVWATDMSEHQLEGYKSAVSETNEDINENMSFKNQNKLQQASNLVYPDGSYGNDGFNKYVFKNDNGELVIEDEMAERIQDIDYIEELSCKFADIIKRANESNHCVYVYSEFTNASGIIMLALFLRAQGYAEFKSGTSVFHGQGNKSFCSAEDKSRRIDQSKFPKAKRFGMIIGTTSPSDMTTLVELQRSYENMYGEYLQFILVSKVGRQGLSFSNVLSIELLDSEWNYDATKQAEMRCIRATSHVDILKDRARRGITEPLVVSIYHHAAKDPSDSIETVNYKMYKLAERKNRRNRMVMRKFKQIAFDCPIHIHRNIRPDEEDGSAECDYQNCEYKCMSEVPDVINVDTYDVYYLQSYLDTLIDRIYKELLFRGGVKLNELYSSLGVSQMYIDLAIDKAISTSNRFLDRFGFKKYIQTDKGMVFLSDSVYVHDTYSSVYYTNNLNIVDLITPTEIELEETSKIEILDEEESETDTILVRTIKLEKALIKFRDTGVRSKILDRYHNFWYKLPYNPLLIEQERMIRRSMNKNVQMRTYRPDELEKFQIVGEPDTYVHNMDLFDELTNAQNDYTITNHFKRALGKQKMLRPGSNVFESPDEVESYIFNTYMQKITYDKLKPYENMGIYILTFRNREAVRNKYKDPILEEGEEVKMNKIHRGRVCSTLAQPQIYEMAWQSQVYPPNSDYSRTRYNQMTDIQLDREGGDPDLPREQKIFYMLWELTETKQNRMTKPQKCDYIMEQMRAKGMNFIIFR